MGNLSLLQGIFLTQEMNQDLLHCRQILYQLSYQENPAAAATAKSLQSCPTLCDPKDGSPPGSSVQWALCRQEYWSGLPCPPPGDLPNPGIKPRSPALQADSSPSELPGKPKNTTVGILSLLQGVFLGQESNQGLPHHRWILYQLSYQGSPFT